MVPNCLYPGKCNAALARGAPVRSRAAAGCVWLRAAMCLVVALLLTGASPATFAHDGSADTAQGAATFSVDELEPLLRALEQLGFERRAITNVFYDRRLRKIDRVVAINAINPDTAEMYRQYTSPYALHLARKFQRRHRQILSQIEGKYGVPQQFIVAILLVESQFGRAHLPYRVLEVFTTLAVEGHPQAVERHYHRLKVRHPAIEKEWLAARLLEKADFAFRELVAALFMFRENLQYLYDVRGSYAGAIGIPQFLPSSYLRWAVDGDGDGRIDLDQLSDALPSVANFLRYHGWSPEAHFRRKWRAVWEYNHSDHYVRTIFEIAFRLSAPSGRKHL